MPTGTEPKEKTSDVVLRRVLHVLAPLVRLLIRHGVDHPRLSSALKRVFIDEARAEVAARQQKQTITALALLAGLQRRDVRTLLEQEGASLPRKALAPTLPMQVAARWVSDARYIDAEGAPLPLPLRASDPAAPTFEALVESVSKDVHAPAVVDELVRLGVVRVADGLIHRTDFGFVPNAQLSDLLDVLAANSRDHLEASVTNVLGREQKFLEFSLFADELRPESVEAMHRFATQAWRSAYRRGVQQASELIARDREKGFADAPEMRLRFGVYFYAEPKNTPTLPAVEGGSGATDKEPT